MRKKAKQNQIKRSWRRVDLKDLQEQVKEMKSVLNPPFRRFSKREKEILAKMVKLTEEVGELGNDILSVLSLQRRSKLADFNRANFYEEFADVIISLIQLANATGVDINRAVKNKLKKIRSQYLIDR